jgi:hypothetical protein
MDLVRYAASIRACFGREPALVITFSDDGGPRPCALVDLRLTVVAGDGEYRMSTRKALGRLAWEVGCRMDGYCTRAEVLDGTSLGLVTLYHLAWHLDSLNWPGTEPDDGEDAWH